MCVSVSVRVCAADIEGGINIASAANAANYPPPGQYCAPPIMFSLSHLFLVRAIVTMSMQHQVCKRTSRIQINVQPQYIRTVRVMQFAFCTMQTAKCLFHLIYFFFMIQVEMLTGCSSLCDISWWSRPMTRKE